jgi:hypothetical protein
MEFSDVILSITEGRSVPMWFGFRNCVYEIGLRHVEVVPICGFKRRWLLTPVGREETGDSINHHFIDPRPTRQNAVVGKKLFSEQGHKSCQQQQ